MTIENKDFVITPPVPFYSQRLDKLNYKVEGFSNFNDAKFWSSRVCGLACIKMAIGAFQGIKVPLHDLLEKGLRINAYTEESGWYHKGLVDLARLYGLDSERQGIGSKIDRIGEYIKENEIIIASVTVGFEAGKVYHSKNGDFTMQKGGHLVVIYGVNFDNKGMVENFSVHHPSSWKSYELPNFKVDRNKFLNSLSSSGNIIRIRKR